MSVRKHYMTLCIRDNTEVTHIERNGVIEVTFEQAYTGGFKTLVMDVDANIIKNDGFNDAEVAYFKDFTLRNKPGIIAESRGEI